MEKYIFIENAIYIDNYKIAFKFSDGKENIVDFGNFITSSKHPDIRKYEDESLFKKFDLKYGEVLWNDYELVFPIYDLHQGIIK